MYYFKKKLYYFIILYIIIIYYKIFSHLLYRKQIFIIILKINTNFNKYLRLIIKYK